MKCRSSRHKCLNQRSAPEELRDLQRLKSSAASRGVKPQIAQLAHHYQTSPDLSVTPNMRAELKVYERKIRAAFAQVEQEVEVVFTLIDPYDSVYRMHADIAKNRRLQIFTGGAPISYLSVEINAMARAVHDLRDHNAALLPFDFGGEVRAWMSATERMPAHRDLLFSEIVLQAALFEVLGFFPDEPQRIVAVHPRLIWSALEAIR